MPLDVEVPPPPTLGGPQDPGDYDAVDENDDRVDDQSVRDALVAALETGAWADAFDDWRRDTYLDEDQFRAATDMGLLDEFDFYANPATGDVGYRVPPVPDDRPAPYDEHLDRNDVQDLEEALDDLGRTVSEVLENDYLGRTGEEFGLFAED